MEKQCADSLQCKLPCGGWPGPPGIQSIPSPLCIFITSFLRVSSWHFLNSHCSRNVLCPGWIRWVTWLGPGMHPITFSVTLTYISNCWNQFVTQFLSSELKLSKVFSVLSVSVSNYGVGQCGLLHVCLSYALPPVLEATLECLECLTGMEKRRSKVRQTAGHASPAASMCLHHVTFQSAHLDKIKITPVTTETERHAWTDTLHWAVRFSLEWELCPISLNTKLEGVSLEMLEYASYWKCMYDVKFKTYVQDWTM